MAYKRSDRVADVIKEEIASMVAHGEIKDPRIGFVTITHVKLSPDLKDARVFFSQIGTEEEKKRSLEGLRSATGYIRKALAKSLKLKHIPTIDFVLDETLEYSERIEKKLREIKKEGGL